jgi:hypothetical protein
MIKSLSVLAIILAAGLFSVPQANARMGLSFNGRNLNGVSENGRNLNGVELNGRVVRQGSVADQGVQATTVILRNGERVTLQ